MEIFKLRFQLAVRFGSRITRKQQNLIMEQSSHWSLVMRSGLTLSHPDAVGMKIMRLPIKIPLVPLTIGMQRQPARYVCKLISEFNY